MEENNETNVIDNDDFLSIIEKYIQDEHINIYWFMDYQYELVSVASDNYLNFTKTESAGTLIAISDFFRNALAINNALYYDSDVASLALLYCYSAIVKFKPDIRNQTAAKMSKLELLHRHEAIYKKIVEDELRETNDETLISFLEEEGAMRILSVLYVEYKSLEEYIVELAMRQNKEYQKILYDAKVVEQFRTPEHALKIGHKWDEILYKMCMRYSLAFNQ